LWLMHRDCRMVCIYMVNVNVKRLELTWVQCSIKQNAQIKIIK
jgi:hypothetical protein